MAKAYTVPTGAQRLAVRMVGGGGGGEMSIVDSPHAMDRVSGFIDLPPVIKPAPKPGNYPVGDFPQGAMRGGFYG